MSKGVGWEYWTEGEGNREKGDITKPWRKEGRGGERGQTIGGRHHDGMVLCKVGLYQRGDGGGMINRKQNLPDYLEEGTEEGQHIPAKLLPKQISKISGLKGRETYPCGPKVCQQEHIRT
jgi:hypothetical protein